MSEIEVGEYIRTTNGEIEKVVLIYDNRYMNEDGNMTHFDEIKAHSKNILDIVEVDDFVNGNLVLDIDVEDGMICLLMPFDEENQTNFNVVWNTKYFIKTILTHELYEQNCYKVEE